MQREAYSCENRYSENRLSYMSCRKPDVSELVAARKLIIPSALDLSDMQIQADQRGDHNDQQTRLAQAYHERHR